MEYLRDISTLIMEDKTSMLLLILVLSVLAIAFASVAHSIFAEKIDTYISNADLVSQIDSAIDLTLIKAAIWIVFIAIVDLIIILYDINTLAMYIVPIVYTVLFIVKLATRYKKTSLMNEYGKEIHAYEDMLQKPFIADNVIAIISTIVIASAPFICELML